MISGRFSPQQLAEYHRDGYYIYQQACLSPGGPIDMNCTLCHRPTPGDVEVMIDAGWIPSYFSGQQPMPGPVCPECCQKHLRIGKDGERETIAMPVDAHRWN